MNEYVEVNVLITDLGWGRDRDHLAGVLGDECVTVAVGVLVDDSPSPSWGASRLTRFVLVGRAGGPSVGQSGKRAARRLRFRAHGPEGRPAPRRAGTLGRTRREREGTCRSVQSWDGRPSRLLPLSAGVCSYQELIAQMTAHRDVLSRALRRRPLHLKDRRETNRPEIPRLGNA